MAIYVGLDVGSVSAKAVVVCANGGAAGDGGFAAIPGFVRGSATLERSVGATVLFSAYRRTLGNPQKIANELLCEIREALPQQSALCVRVTGSGARLAAENMRAALENEFKAIAHAVGRAYPEVRTIFEIGGESSKYLALADGNERELAVGSNGQTYATGIADYSSSGECAAGTGSFLDQQATRLKYRVEEIGEVVAKAKCAARIAGRCSVFAKSDMIHAQQKGFSTGEVLKGLCEAVARNFKSNIVRGKPVKAQVALIGAVSQNRGVAQALREAFRLREEQLFVPEEYAWMGALGCALLEQEQAGQAATRRRSMRPRRDVGDGEPCAQKDLPALSLKNVLLLRDHPEASRMVGLPRGREMLSTYLGIDIGSVSTNLALLDDAGRLLHGIYLRTSGRPIEVVQEGLQEIDQLFGGRIVVRGTGTTGSGRELIGELVGADTVNDEITAHKTGALFVHQKMVKGKAESALGSSEGPGEVDTIFEIGGQDSKFISIDHGVVVDFAMNEACAAGTGSFLEEQAERMGISITDEFAARAFASKAPARLGERCTVFMERDVTAWMQRGARVDDLAAGLAYSVAVNYLNRVVRGRKIGEVIYFQGGTAYNDAVAAAFSQILGKRIIVPPHNGIIGAIGMALIAQQVTRAKERVQEQSAAPVFAFAVAAGGGSYGTVTVEVPPATISTFRGFDLDKVSYQTREFVCKACSNYCDMREITVDGRKTYWGDKCSDKFRKRTRSERRPVIGDLMTLHDQLLLEGFPSTTTGNSNRPRVGIPRATFFYDRFPFWRTYLQGIGFDLELSGPTDQQTGTRGAELSIAEPCFPVQIAHGHIHALLQGTAERAPVDFVFVPNVMDMEAPESPVASHLCPWNQTLPFVVRSAPELERYSAQFLTPTLHFRAGAKHVKSQLAHYFHRFGVSRRESDRAVDVAYDAQAHFSQQLVEEGLTACATLRATGEPAVLLLGRPYNIYDRGGNCDIPRKLRDLYGVNVLPLDFLPLDEGPIDDLHPKMFWNSGRRILAAGRFAREHQDMHIVYITNFKCGPDSFVKHFLRDVVQKPFLILQFDGHGNDAGYLTRCEAYLDSKGLLRCGAEN